jgi:hypothetical protein
MSGVSPRWTRGSGLVIAGLGVLLIRRYVAETVVVDELLLSGLVSLPPLVVGPGLTVSGVALAVGYPVVGRLTHCFHSVIFALLFATGYQYTDRARLLSPPLRVSLFGVGWGTVLWFVAAGFVMPVWLQLFDIPTQIPRLTMTSFVAHTIRGRTLGPSYALLVRSTGFDT